jgi:hypothetical protein
LSGVGLQGEWRLSCSFRVGMKQNHEKFLGWVLGLCAWILVLIVTPLGGVRVLASEGNSTLFEQTQSPLRLSGRFQEFYLPGSSIWTELGLRIDLPEWHGIQFGIASGLAGEASESRQGIGGSDLKLHLAVPSLFASKADKDWAAHSWHLMPEVVLGLPLSSYSSKGAGGGYLQGRIRLCIQQGLGQWGLCGKLGVQGQMDLGLSASQSLRVTLRPITRLSLWIFAGMSEGTQPEGQDGGAGDLPGEISSVRSEGQAGVSAQVFQVRPLRAGLGFGLQGGSGRSPASQSSFLWRVEVEADLAGLLRESRTFALAFGVSFQKEWSSTSARK